MLRAHVSDFVVADHGARRRLDPLVILRLVVRWADQLLCGLRGHAMVRHFEGRRLSLQCLACGAQTRGWTLDARPPR